MSSHGDLEEGDKKSFSKSTSATNTAADLEQDPRYTFEDYVLPSTPIPPPAKYKLWLLILTLVFFADWFSSEAGFVSWLERTFLLSFDGALFVFLYIVVGTLIYGALDLIQLFLTVKIKDKVYGLGWWMKQPRTRWIHEYENFPVQFIRRIVQLFEDGFAIFTPKKIPSSSGWKQFECPEAHKDVVLKIQHHVKPDMIEAFNEWKQTFIKTANDTGLHAAPGLKRVQPITDDEKDIHITYLTFDCIDSLNEYMASPIRARLVRNLQPLLVRQSSQQLIHERELPDAFTDLATEQGGSVPARPPKKWKVWFLTTVGLFFVLLVTQAVLPEYFAAWGLNKARPRAQALVRVIINTYLNSYVATPFLTMIFGDWLRRGGHEDDIGEPWTTLNDGFKSVWGKVAITLVFYGGCAIAWGVNVNT